MVPPMSAACNLVYSVLGKLLGSCRHRRSSYPQELQLKPDVKGMDLRTRDRPEQSPVRSANTSVQISVQKSETRLETESKKFTVYKLVVSSPSECWFLYRRYNEFYKLHDTIKRQGINSNLKLPGKKIFGNNLDPNFVASRRQGLDSFLQQLLADDNLLSLREVREFLELDSHRLSLQPGDSLIDLGPSERCCTRPADFEFVNVIGKGSFGKVCLARHTLDNTYYAIKVVNKKKVIRENEGKYVMSERNVLIKNLEHPFLVALKFSFQTPGKLFFVLDYINGGELFLHLQRERKFSEDRSRFYAAEISSALGYLHGRGVVYRDLKPENLLLDSEGHVVLTDFGLSKEGLLPTDTTDTFCGTPEYLAPEIIKNQAYDKSVDWWCLGVVLYEMLYGLPPFYSTDRAELYTRILQCQVTLRKGITSPARRIIAQLLEKDSCRRLGSGYGDFDDVKAHEFFTAVNWDDLLARKIKPPFCPAVEGVTDLSNVDPSLKTETISWSPAGHSQLSISVQSANGDPFAGFSYAP